jgi:hypothetical protein
VRIALLKWVFHSACFLIALRISASMPMFQG